MNAMLGEISFRALLVVLMIFAFGCRDYRDPDAIDLDTALENTEKGQYALIAVSNSPSFVSFQKSWDHKKQYYFDDADRDKVLKKLADTIHQARKNGHSIGTMGLDEFIEE